MKYHTLKSLIVLATTLSVASPLYAQNLNIVPYPKQVETTQATPFSLEQGYSINTPKEFEDAAKLFIEDTAALYQIEGKIAAEGAAITLVKDATLPEEGYKLSVESNGITIAAANYNSMVMGMTTALQMMDKERQLPTCSIVDTPSFPYRCFMIDVARQWNELDTIKQMIDMSRWYKIRYVQIHLTDDQQFTFESKAYPKLNEGKPCYTQEQLKELVAYAAQRGIILVPEFDLPGHSTAMRRQMPELFGASGWSMVDVVNPECMKAVKTIAKEMMDVFYTSPYFHIGADEVWLGAYEKLDHVQDYLKNNKDKVDYPHDLYMQFIVDMHEFVKANGKKTLVWESFQGTGSRKVKIPKDIIVLAWETMFQRPDSLINNGYTIINSTWKPCYIIPNRRWAPEYIYNWNARLWENHTASTPSYKQPIQLEKDIPLMGVQMNSWEMMDYVQLLSTHKRIPAFSETAWNDNAKQPFADYDARAKVADEKIMRIMFPAKETSTGFKPTDPTHINDNRSDYYGNEASVFFEPIDKEDTIYYTTDKSMPTTASQQLTEPINFVYGTTSMVTYVKFIIVDKDGKTKGYRSAAYTHKPLDYEVSGDVLPLRDRTRGSFKDKENFGDNLIIELTNHMPDRDVYYTLDGSLPTTESQKYTEPVVVTETGIFHAAALNEKGKPIGVTTKFNVVKKDKDAPID